MKKKGTDEEKIIAMLISEKEFLSLIYDKLLHVNKKGRQPIFLNGQNIDTGA